MKKIISCVAACILFSLVLLGGNVFADGGATPGGGALGGTCNAWFTECRGYSWQVYEGVRYI